MRRLFRFNLYDYRATAKQWFEHSVSLKDLDSLSKVPFEVLKKLPEEFISNFPLDDESLRIHSQIGKCPSVPNISQIPPSCLVELLRFPELKEEALHLLKNYKLDPYLKLKAWVYSQNPIFECMITKHSISSFEELSVFAEACALKTSDKDIEDWLFEETKALVSTKEIQLDYVLKIYKIVSPQFIRFFNFCEFYRNLLDKYLKSMLPEQLEQYLEALLLSESKDYNKKRLFEAVFEINTNEVSYKALSSIVESLGRLKIGTPSKFFSKLLNESSSQSLTDLIRACEALLVSSQDVSPLIDAIQARLDEASADLRIDFYRILLLYKVPDMKMNIEEDINHCSFQGLLSALFCSRWLPNDFFQTCQTLIMGELESISYGDLYKLISIIGKISFEDRIISPELNEKLAELTIRFKRSIKLIDLPAIAHHFSYIFYTPTVLDLLKNMVLESEEENEILSSPKDHYYYLEKDGEYTVLKNKLLTPMNLQSLIVFCTSVLHSKSLEGEFQSIIDDYTESILQKYYWQLNQKHRLSLFYVLSLSENYSSRYEPYLLNIESIFETEKFESRGLTTYRSAVKNLQNTKRLFNLK